MMLRKLLCLLSLFALVSCSDPSGDAPAEPESAGSAESASADSGTGAVEETPKEPASSAPAAEAPAAAATPPGAAPAADTDAPAAAPGAPRVTLTTNHGDIVIELDPESAPASVENFLAYASEGFFDNTVFHRVISGFMIQGGGFGIGEDGAIAQKETKPPIQNEAKNGLKNARGTVAMARTGDPHSATAQFFINHKDNTNLDHPSFDGWGYAVFGKVVEGMDVVDAIAGVQTGTSTLTTKVGPRPMQDVPADPVVIQSAKVSQ